MKIECTIRRKLGSTVTLGTTTYKFGPGDGPHIAEVTDEDHIARLLAVPDSFKIHNPKGGKAAPVAPAPAASVETLLGSSSHPASFEINGKTYSLGEVASMAHEASGLSVADWNAASEEDRASAIDDQLDLLANEEEDDGDDELEAARRAYREKFDKEPHPKAKAATLRAKVEEA